MVGSMSGFGSADREPDQGQVFYDPLRDTFLVYEGMTPEGRCEFSYLMRPEFRTDRAAWELNDSLVPMSEMEVLAWMAQ